MASNADEHDKNNRAMILTNEKGDQTPLNMEWGKLIWQMRKIILWYGLGRKKKENHTW